MTKPFLAAALVLVATMVLAGACQRRVLPEHMYQPDSVRRQKAQQQFEKEDVHFQVEKPKTISPMRTWTSASGDSKIDGALIEVKDGKAWLLQDNGAIAGIPLDRLSEADRRYAEETAGQ